MLRHIAALSTALTLAACGQDEAAPVMDTPDTAEPAPMPETPPPIGPQPARYPGRWAASETLCRDGAWTFGERSLSTAGEVSCTFSQVTQTGAGYQIDAACLAEGVSAQGRLNLAFAQSAGAMRVTGGPYGWDIGLIRCAGAGAN